LIAVAKEIKLDDKQLKSLELKIILLEEELKFKEKEVEGLKGAFLANVSHEIRTPMNAIVGFANLLKDPSYTKEEKRDFANEIVTASNQLTEFVEDIVDVANMQFDKKTQSNVEVIDPHKLLFSVFEMSKLRKDVMSKGHIKMIVKSHENSSRKSFVSNLKILKKILCNIVDHAFKYIKEGSVELSVDFYNNYIEFVVKDTGIGISKEKLPLFYHSFSKLWRKDGEIVYDGLGIGLSSAKNFVDIIGGHMDVKSYEGKGSSFFIRVPYKMMEDKLTIDEEEVGTDERQKTA